MNSVHGHEPGLSQTYGNSDDIPWDIKFTKWLCDELFHLFGIAPTQSEGYRVLLNDGESDP
jgi:hypothetical protein